MKRGDTLYEDKESAVDAYLDCRDGIVNCVEYTDGSGYGSKTKLYVKILSTNLLVSLEKVQE